MDEQTIFTMAMEKKTPAERAAFLDQACGGNAELRRDVDLLLKAHEKAGSFLENPPAVIAPTMDHPAEKLGTYIDRYKLVHEIGHGGMGMVYMAVQKEPVKRKVALKIIKPGMDTEEVVARFEAERQALALMDHQCIAKVLDGGSTPSGRPYFVMELVDGTPITEYCNECRFTTRQRLELFVQVCQAVQHAHQKGVIHRDLKPSNILVTNVDDRAVPKVIDFGIAKAVHGQLADHSVYTRVARMMGTPMYMSPEQAERTGHDVDTRTDVYSLGVLLYELLTGTPPFDQERLQSSSVEEVKRIIREEEPPRPSTRLSTVDAALETIAETHRTDLRTLTRELTGELDWIVMKALEKDRTRRYESASDLAKDLQRYLKDEAVEASPPSRTYRLRKFAGRNKAQLLTVATIAAVLLIATVVSSSLAAWAIHERGIANENLVAAKRNEATADRERAAALDATAIAKQQEQLAEQQREAAEYNNYVSSIRLARLELDQGEAIRVLHALTALAPEPDRPDLRGWEWYYLSSPFHGERFAFPFQEDAIAWSPDDKKLATVDRVPGLVNIWDVSTGRLVLSLNGPYGTIHSVAWSPDGRHLAAAGDRRSIAIWDLESGERIRSLRGHAAAIRTIDWNPVDARLVSGAEDGTIYIWDTQTGKRSLSLRAPRPVRSLHWHPEGALILATTGVPFQKQPGVWMKPTTRIWDATSGEEIAHWGDHGHARFSPDGSRVACWVESDGVIHLRVTAWETPELLQHTLCSGGTQHAWSPDGAQVVAGHPKGTLQFRDAATGEETRSILSRSAASSIACSPEWGLLAASGKDGTVRVWEPAEQRHVRVFSTPGKAALSVAFAPDSRRLLVGGRDGVLRIWDVDLGDEILALQHGHTWSNCAAWSPDGTRFACRSGGSNVRICSAETGELVLPLLEGAGERTVWCLDWSPEGKKLAIGDRRRQYNESITRIRLWDMSSGEMIAHSRDLPGSCDALSWSPDGKRLLVPLSAGGRVLDVALRQEKVFSRRIKGRAAWSPDGRQAAVGTRDITIVDTASWEPIRVLRGHRQGVRAISWHPRMPRLATGGDDQTVRIWDTSTGRELHSFAMPEVVTAVTWSPNGRRLASTGFGGKVRVWDTSPALGHLAGHGELREEAYDFVKAGNYDEAIRVVERLSELHPEEALLQTQLARLRWLRAVRRAGDGLTDETLGTLQRLQAEHPTLPDYRVTVANAAFDAGRHAEAFEMLERLIAQHSEMPEYRAELAYLYEARATALCESGEVKQALPLLRKLAEDFPDRPDSRIELAFKATAKGHLESTMAALESLSETFEHWPDYRPELARHLTETGRYVGVATIYKSLVRDIPGMSEDKPELARHLIATNQYAKAEKAIAEIEELFAKAPHVPEDGEALVKLRNSLVKQLREDLARGHFLRADGLFHSGKLDEAFPHLNDAIRVNAEYSEALDHRGHVYRSRGELEKAIADYNKSIHFGAAYGTDTYTGRGSVYAAQKKFDQAIADFTEGIRLKPDRAAFWYRRASARLGANDLDGYRKACGAMHARFGDSDDPAKAHWLAWTCALAPDALADFSPVVSAAEMAVEKNPQSIRYLNTLGAIRYRAGRAEEAIERLTEADKLMEKPDSAARSSPAYTWYFLAMAQHKLGQEEEAQKWLDKATEWTDQVMAQHEEGTATVVWNRRLTLTLLRDEAEGMIRVTVDEAKGDTQSAKEEEQEAEG